MTNLTEAKSKLLNEFGTKKNLDFWKEAAPGEEADILASPSESKSLKSWLQKQNISFTVIIKNVQKEMDKERKSVFSDYLGKQCHNFYDFHFFNCKFSSKVNRKIFTATLCNIAY